MITLMLSGAPLLARLQNSSGKIIQKSFAVVVGELFSLKVTMIIKEVRQLVKKIDGYFGAICIAERFHDAESAPRNDVIGVS